jgi:hypothetical protein
MNQQPRPAPLPPCSPFSAPPPRPPHAPSTPKPPTPHKD